jgi:hypothetical protein
VLLAWLGEGDPKTALVMLGCMAVAAGCGYGILRAFARGDADVEMCLLALPAGLTTLAAAAHAAAAYGVSLVWLAWFAVIASIPGLYLMLRSLRGAAHSRPRGGLLTLGAVVAVAVVYFAPISFGDNVRTSDGGHRWLYVDSMYHSAIASVLTNEAFPPRVPNFGRQPLVYHYGPHAFAAAVAVGAGIEPGTALSRVARPIGLLALCGAVLALARWTSASASNASVAGPFGLALVFFVGSWYEVVAAPRDSSMKAPPEAGWVRQQLAAVPSDYGYKGHFLVGSGLWGLVLLATVAALLARKDTGASLENSPGGELPLAVLGASISGVAGPAAAGVVAADYVLCSNKRTRKYVALLFLIVGHAVVAKFVVFARSTEPLILVPNTATILAIKWTSLVAWLGLALGFKLLSFQLLDGRRRHAAINLAVFCLGFIGTFLLVHEKEVGDEGYCMLYLSGLLSAYAAAPMASFINGLAGIDEVPNVKTLTVFAIIATGATVAASVVLWVWIPAGWYARAILLCGAIGLLSFAWLLSQAARHGLHGFRSFANLALAALLVASSTGWIPVVACLGWNRGDVSIEVDAPRVETLSWLRRELPPDALVATSHSSLPGVTRRPERSAVYSALSSRYMLLEGWEYGAGRRASSYQIYPDVKSDNDLVFTGTNSETVRQAVRRQHVSHIVIEPGESLGFQPESVDWLRRLSTAGSLTVYEVAP